MSRPWRALRVQLAVLGFLAIYVPVLLLVGVAIATEEEEARTDAAVAVETSRGRSGWVTVTVIALAPAAAGLAWWWAGRAVAPIQRVRAIADDITANDLSRRIALDHGPTEVVGLAASFDGMLDRLAHAADAQRRLIEETSHELRTPLSVLTTNADVLLAQPAATAADYRRGLERTQATAARMRSTIDDLLVDARGRARTLDRRPADVAALVASVLDEAGAVAGAKGVHLVADAPPTVHAAIDETTVRRALTNLVRNAISAAPPGTAVEVVVEVDGDRTRDGGGGEHMVTLSVTDHGAGIAPADQDRVFERFWQGHGTADGTGLGLPIARQIASAHGGELTLSSPGPTGDGCQFRLSLRSSVPDRD